MIAADGVPPPPKLKKKGWFGANTERGGHASALDIRQDFRLYSLSNIGCHGDSQSDLKQAQNTQHTHDHLTHSFTPCSQGKWGRYHLRDLLFY